MAAPQVPTTAVHLLLRGLPACKVKVEPHTRLSASRMDVTCPFCKGVRTSRAGRR